MDSANPASSTGSRPPRWHCPAVSSQFPRAVVSLDQSIAHAHEGLVHKLPAANHSPVHEIPNPAPQHSTERKLARPLPGTGIIFHYLTNLPASVPPGIVALLYKLRWYGILIY
jgi:hypothetical protein